MKNIVVSACALIVVGAGLFCIVSREQRASDELVVGVLSSYAPFCMLNAAGELEGFDVDVAYELARRMNKKITFKEMSTAALFIAIRQNKVDLILSSLSITRERQEVVAMVYYYGTPTTQFPLVFWQTIPTGIGSLDDLVARGATVCVEPGSFQEAYLQQYDNVLTVKRMSALSEIVMDIRYGKSDAALLDPEVVGNLMDQAPALQVLMVDVPQAYQSMGCGIALNKGRNDLINEVDAIIGVMRTDGTIARLQEKWRIQ